MIKNSCRMTRRTMIGTLLATACPRTWSSPLYPDHPIKIVVPFAPGSGIDIVTRIYTASLGKELGSTLITVNIAGAGGNIGAANVARSAPDGYTLMSTSPVFTGSGALYKSLPFNPDTDLSPVALLAAIPSVLIVRPGLAAHTVEELSSLAKKTPNELTFGSTGMATLPHILGEAFALEIDAKMLHVPYKGSPQILNELIGGRLDFAFANLASVLSQITAGEVRALAVTSKQRSKHLPNVPTMESLGFKDFIFDTLIALMTPAKVPPLIKRQLNEAVVRVAGTASIQEQLSLQGVEVRYGDEIEVVKIVQQDRIRRERVISRAHIEGA